jgi:hypothetical protein
LRSRRNGIFINLKSILKKLYPSPRTNLPSKMKLIELKKFYEYKSKLLIATEHFIGFDPVISLPFMMPKTPATGEQVATENLLVAGEQFIAKLSSKTSGSNGKRYKRIEIYKNNKRIILFEKGSNGNGGNYSKGKNFFVDGDKAYLLIKGIWLKDFEDYFSYGEINSFAYYVLAFSNIAIPKKYVVRKIKKRKSESTLQHVASKIKLWEGAIHTSEGVIQVTCTTILAVENALPQIKKPRGIVEFTIDRVPHYFENF